MAESETIFIKPHHFLDIIKLHGGGYEKFMPDKNYGHDFWRVGNRILEKPDTLLELTLGLDAVCEPCRFNGGFMCTDMTKVGAGETSKDGFNQKIDQALLKVLGLDEGARLTALEFCRLAKAKLTARNIAEIWKDKPVKETKKRIELLFEGIDRYIEGCK